MRSGGPLANAMVGQCRFTPGSPRVVSAWFQRLKLKHVEPLSNCAFNFTLRPSTLDLRQKNLANTNIMVQYCPANNDDAR